MLRRLGIVRMRRPGPPSDDGSTSCVSTCPSPRPASRLRPHPSAMVRKYPGHDESPRSWGYARTLCVARRGVPPRRAVGTGELRRRCVSSCEAGQLVDAAPATRAVLPGAAVQLLTAAARGHRRLAGDLCGVVPGASARHVPCSPRCRPPHQPRVEVLSETGTLVSGAPNACAVGRMSAESTRSATRHARACHH